MSEDGGIPGTEWGEVAGEGDPVPDTGYEPVEPRCVPEQPHHHPRQVFTVAGLYVGARIEEVRVRPDGSESVSKSVVRRLNSQIIHGRDRPRRVDDPTSMIVVREHDGMRYEFGTHYADLALEPYHTGLWNKRNYVRLAESQRIVPRIFAGLLRLIGVPWPPEPQIIPER